MTVEQASLFLTKKWPKVITGRYVKIELLSQSRIQPIDRGFPNGGATDSTGLNRCGKACRVPSSRKTIGKQQLPIISSLHTLLN